jgi:hypothetical protein
MRPVRESWRRAYELLPPTRAEAAVALLAPVLDAGEVPALRDREAVAAWA